ncbi:MAG: hypothetical protein Ta2F_13000 [Termitinemataceae bacterium]|nr:MAG: hypothetical protein Ta2F_13000 [Termitinemataceae bacterium]
MKYKSFKSKLSFAMPVAVIITAILLTLSCKGASDLGGDVASASHGGYVPPRNIDPATQLKTLNVQYEGVSAGNLIVFNSTDGEEDQLGEYLPGHMEPSATEGDPDVFVPDSTDATRQFITVNAAAKSPDAYIKIWWTNGNSGDGMENATKSTASLTKIPVPTTQDITYVNINVVNGDGMFEYIIQIPPPVIDTTLKTLALTPGTLTPEFSGHVTNYSVSGLTASQSITISAEANAPDEENPQVTIDGTVGNSKTVVGPAAGAANKIITVTVTNQSMTSEYQITLISPQVTLNNVSTLQHVQFYYVDDTQNPAVETPVIAGGAFTTDHTDYTFSQIPSGAVKVKLGEATATSSNAQSIVVQQGIGTLTDYASANASTLTGTYNAINLPAKPTGNAQSQVLRFVIVVKAQDGSTTPYTFAFSNPKKTVSWQGTIEATGSGSANLTFTRVDIEYIDLDGSKQTKSTETALSQPGNGWSITLDDRITPSAFVAVMINTANNATYRESFANGVNGIGNTYSNNVLQVVASNTARLIFNASGLKAIGDSANQGVNWFLNNDIDLSEAPGDWEGPSGYYGVFDGNGKTIKNLLLTKTGSDTGLFATLGDGATIKNFTLEVKTPSPLNMTNSVHFGGVVGLIDVTTPTAFITLKNIRVEGTLEYNGLTGNKYLIVGGLVGEVNQNSKVNIEKCVSAIDVEANITNDSSSNNYDAVVGGFAGKLLSGIVNITDSYSTGNVLLTNSGNRHLAAGGLIGTLGNAGNSGANIVEIKNSYSTGTVEVRLPSGSRTVAAGGLVGGYQSGTINFHNSVALNASIIATGAGTINTGRVIGVSSTSVTLADNYANSAMTINSTAVSGTDTDAGKTKKHGEGKALTAMNQTFWTVLGFTTANWDYTNYVTGQGPKLK